MYKSHIWDEDTSHRYTFGGTKIKVICQGQPINFIYSLVKNLYPKQTC